MTIDLVPFASRAYFVLLTILLCARGMDILSTWIATPNLTLEANPLFRKIGWKASITITLLYCFPVAILPFPTIVVSTVSALVAARNFQNAWMMRTMGELNYSLFMREQIAHCPRGLFNLCLILQTIVTFAVGLPLMMFAPFNSVVFPIGSGICGFALVQLTYILLSVRRIRRI